MLSRIIRRIPGLKRFGSQKPVVPVVRMSGVIGSGGRFGQALNLEGVAPLLARAFDVDNAKAVAIIMNSPGGSPVQSGLVYSRIRALADEKKKLVYVFTEDVAASGGYLISLAADEIYVHDASIVGSIGVISAGFGFPEAIKKLGVERRVYTSGESKSMLDAFQPENPDDIARLKDLQAQIHTYFKSLVETRRSARLRVERSRLFSGEVWVGEAAVEAGLVDGVGDIRAILRDKFGEDVQLPVIAQKQGFRLPIPGLASKLAAGIVDTAEARVMWSRYGL